VNQVSAAAAPAQSAEASVSTVASTTLAVEIPCSGHAPLISGELKGVPGVQKVTFRAPNLFDVTYDSGQTSLDQIVALDVFQAYPATVNNP